MKLELRLALLTTALMTCMAPNTIADQVVDDDLIVEGSICSSDLNQCVDGEPFPNFAGLKIKDSLPSIYLNDTSTTPGTSDWAVQVDLTTFTGEFAIRNVAARTHPLIIENGCATNLLYLDNLQRIGINTNVPEVDLDIRSTLPAIRLDDTSEGAGQVDLQMDTDTFAIEGDTDQDIVKIHTAAPAESFTISATGDVNLGIGTITMRGHAEATSFSVASSRDRKDDFRPIDPQAVLSKLVALPLSEWSCREETGVRHLGPMAEDFADAFGLGSSTSVISLQDVAGVALAAVQGLERALVTESEQLLHRLARQEQALHGLMAEVERLRTLLEPVMDR